MVNPTLVRWNTFPNLKKIKLVFLLFLFVLKAGIDKTSAQNTCKILSYNVENLFDHVDDSLTQDAEFTPEGTRRWTFYKYKTKVNKIAKVIVAAGGFDPVGMVGLIEIENRQVLDRLVYDSPLKKFNYRVIHQDSPDQRGIDVALIYRRECYKPINNRFVKVEMHDDPNFKTRDILYSKGLLFNDDTVHVFVNHWPSRYGGVAKSRPKRWAAATTLKAITDSIIKVDSLANIVIMGDFNDYPGDESLQHGLGVGSDGYLVNLAENSSYDGSYKYQGRWGFLDQIIVSNNIVRGESLALGNPSFTVVRESFMLEKDKTYTGDKPYRTFVGYKYNRGYSDHLPVMLTFVKKR